MITGALVLFDVFKGQCTSKVLKMLKDDDILYVTVPNNCTDRLQPLDLSVNKLAKDFLQERFQQWYRAETCQQLDRCVTEQVDVRMTVINETIGSMVGGGTFFIFDSSSKYHYKWFPCSWY